MKNNAVLLIIIAFAGALIISVGVNLFVSPDFAGFGGELFGEPVVTYLSDRNGEGDGNTGNAYDKYDWNDHPVYIVGDSLTQGARNDISKTLGDVTIDAKVGRNMSTGLSILRGWKDSGVLADDAIIIVCLAHNITDSTVKDAQEVIAMIEPGQSLIMMTGHGRGNMEPINEYLRSLPKAYSYITVADWDSTIAQSPSLLSDDGIHISRKQGNEVYANLIMRALEETRPMR